MYCLIPDVCLVWVVVVVVVAVVVCAPGGGGGRDWGSTSIKNLHDLSGKDVENSLKSKCLA